MRTTATLTSFSGDATPSTLSPAATPSALQHSPWHSPVPYLFGGLAAMLGLIAFALLILACSYWRLSGYLDDAAGEDEARNGDGKPSDSTVKSPPCFGEGIVVIMAGDQKPTYLATPILCKACSSSDSIEVDGKVTGGEKDVDLESGLETARSGVSGEGGDRNHEVE